MLQLQTRRLRETLQGRPHVRAREAPRSYDPYCPRVLILDFREGTFVVCSISEEFLSAEYALRENSLENHSTVGLSGPFSVP